jgi:putative ABC transport system permease protein
MRFWGLARLALRDIAGSVFRSWLIGFCALFIAGFLLATVLVIQGALDSLNLASQRLGADIVVMPQGDEAAIEGALLMGVPVRAWMPATNVAKIAAISGVTAASPQLYLSSLNNVSCCTVSEMFMVAFDPSTDFTIKPWLDQRLGGELGLGQTIGGRYVCVPEGAESIKLYGYVLSLRDNFEATGTNLDQTMFMTFDTAYDMASKSYTAAVKPLVIPRGKVSSVMVKVASGSDTRKVAAEITSSVANVVPVRSPDMFGEYRKQISGVLRVTLVLLGLTAILSIALLSFVFSMATHERSRQIGVLRALGATRGGALTTLLTEAGVLALAGGVAGVVIAAAGVYLFRGLLVKSLGFPFIYPSAGSLLGLVAAGLAVALVVVTLAALLPALRISRQEPANSMRE